MMPIWFCTSAPVHDDDELLELRRREPQRFLVRGAAHANPKLESARLGEPVLSKQLRQLLLDCEVLDDGLVVVEVVGLDFPERAGERLQRIAAVAAATRGRGRSTIGRCYQCASGHVTERYTHLRPDLFADRERSTIPLTLNPAAAPLRANWAEFGQREPRNASQPTDSEDKR